MYERFMVTNPIFQVVQNELHQLQVGQRMSMIIRTRILRDQSHVREIGRVLPNQHQNVVHA